MVKPHSQKHYWLKKDRKKLWTRYTIFLFIVSTILLLWAIYYNGAVYYDGRRYFYFYLISGLFYVFTGISSVYLVLNLISDIKTKKKLNYLGDIKIRFFLEVEGTVNYYLKVNEGKIYTAEVLVSKLEKYFKGSKKKEYYRNNIETMLNLMVQRGTIQQEHENGKIHYSF